MGAKWLMSTYDHFKANSSLMALRKQELFQRMKWTCNNVLFNVLFNKTYIIIVILLINNNRSNNIERINTSDE